MTGTAIFPTAIGACGIAWRPEGVAGIQLPEAATDTTRARLRRRFPDATDTTPPAPIARAITAIQTLLAGTPTDLSAVPLDMTHVPPFHRRVYAFARSIPPGATMSYGQVAIAIGAPGSARAVGQALGRNPFAIVVPCHRVLAASGAIGGFSARGGVSTKRRLLGIEGVPIGDTAALF
jgi:methylated-DNA-[protein]-cysteine S-methyltransferase